MILDSVATKELFQSVVKRAKAKYAFRIENFCIMGNHYHLVILPARGENLTAIMRWIMSVFAMAYNKIHGHTGHVWGGRCFSRIIRGLRELAQVFEFLDANPEIAN
jgi:putative transposase